MTFLSKFMSRLTASDTSLTHPKQIKRKVEDSRFAGAPKIASTKQTCDLYPQPLAYPVLTAEEIQDQYAPNIKQLQNACPLPRDEFERLIAPLLNRLIRYVHLLPASEYHHPAGPGGLFVHSIQVATYAVCIISVKPCQGKGQSYEQKHVDRTRWIVAAIVAALIHDVGKSLDVDIRDGKGNVWNPDLASLLDWARTCNIVEYFVIWKSTREHKEHPLRSLRFAYRDLLPKDLVLYLADHSESGILSAIEDAVVYGTGPLGTILKEAEAQSLHLDSEVRRHIQTPVMSQISLSPTARAIVFALKDLSAHSWTVNESTSQIRLTNLGTFIVLNKNNAQQIRSNAVEHGNTQVPASPAGLADVLLAEGLITPQSSRDGDTFWTIRCGSNVVSSCIKLSSPSLLSWRPEPPVDAEVVDDALMDGSPTSIEPQTFLAPKGNFVRLETRATEQFVPQETASKSDGLFEHEYSEILSEPPSAQEAMAFVKRVIHTLAQESDSQPKPKRLLDAGVSQTDGTAVFCSLKIEELLKHHRMSTTTFNSLARMADGPIQAVVSVDDHQLLICRRLCND